MSKHLSLVAAMVVAFSVVPAAPAAAQLGGLKARMKEKVKQRAEQRVEQGTDLAADKAIEAAEKAVRCVVSDLACIRKAKESGQQVLITDQSGAPVSGADSARALQQATEPASPAIGKGAWANYDFTPGERVLAAEDFTSDNVGDFPKRLTFKSGNMEVVEWQGGRYLRATQSGELAISLPSVLPERFTLEMDVYQGARRQSWGAIELRFGGPTSPSYVSSNWTRGGILGAVRAETDVGMEKFADAFVPLRVMADGQHVKVYMGDTRVANVPNAELGRDKQILVKVPATAESPAMIGAIRVAAGGRKLYDALAETGRVATQGIYFDTGSDRLRPESAPTLKEIAEMLTTHPDLKLVIEGHTDNVGHAAANQTLSEQRAAAVRAYLVSEHGIAADRLTSIGYGATKPAVPNTTSEGRQQNRRVELVRQ